MKTGYTASACSQPVLASTPCCTNLQASCPRSSTMAAAKQQGCTLAAVLLLTLLAAGYALGQALEETCLRQVSFKVVGRSWAPAELLDPKESPLFSTTSLGHEHHLAVHMSSPQECAPHPSGSLGVQLRGGTSDQAVFMEIWLKHEFKFLDQFLLPGGPVQRILDLGGNCGMASLYFTTHWPSAQVIAVEPGLGNFNMMTLNLQGRSNVFLERAAASQQSGYALFVDRHSGHWAYGTSDIEVAEIERQHGLNKKALPTVSVDYLLSKYHWDTIDYMKIDIEGGEQQLCQDLLLGAKWGDVVRCMTFEFHDRYVAGVSTLCRQAMSQRGFVHKGAFGELDLFCKQ